MAYDGRYDDPKFINAFLTGMKIEDEDSTQADNTDIQEPLKTNVDSNNGQVQESKQSSGTNTPLVASAVSSPHGGIRAPPPTPESVAMTAADTEHLPAIDEDQDEDVAKISTARKSANSSPQFRADARTFHPLATVFAQDVSMNTVAGNVQDNDDIKNYHHETLHQIREQAEDSLAMTVVLDESNHLNYYPDNVALKQNDAATQVPELDGPPETQVTEPDASADRELINPNSSVTSEVLRDMQDESTFISDLSGDDDDEDDDDDSVEIIVDAPTSPRTFVKKNAALPIVAPKPEATGAHKKVNRGKREASTSDKHQTQDKVAVKEQPVKEEPRENALYFLSWGAPLMRNTNASRVRKVILTNLPSGADSTLVQSIIHGGTIEEMSIVPASNGTTNGTTNAYVTFTHGDACDAYYKQYPNGLEFRHKGKKQTVFVTKGTEVNVVSGVMQSYLDCGATRVVKVVGAEEDWTMTALRRIGEGDKAVNKPGRKVEAIVDSYRNDTRTITFRFTKIADAVVFRNQLLRHSDWQHTDVQFDADPCARATGIH